MKDEEILRLYRERSETALTETERQYGALCGTIARNILRNRQDAEECVNDTWHRAWNSIPPEEPRSLAAYLGRITRNLALNRLQKQNRLKRGGGEMTLIWEEPGRDAARPGHPGAALGAQGHSGSAGALFAGADPGGTDTVPPAVLVGGAGKNGGCTQRHFPAAGQEHTGAAAARPAQRAWKRRRLRYEAKGTVGACWARSRQI